jgi:hypothetical protein
MKLNGSFSREVSADFRLFLIFAIWTEVIFRKTGLDEAPLLMVE